MIQRIYNSAVHNTVFTDFPGQAAGIDTAQPGNAILFQELVQRDVFMGVGGLYTPFPYHIAAGDQFRRSVGVYSSVPNQGIGLYHNLAAVSRVRQQILIRGTVGIKYHFPYRFGALSHGITFIYGPVFQHKIRLGDFILCILCHLCNLLFYPHSSETALTEKFFPPVLQFRPAYGSLPDGPPGRIVPVRSPLSARRTRSRGRN